MTALKSANLALAFLLELAALAAFADWGLGASDQTLIRLLLGIGIPVLAAVVWGIFAAPKSTRRLNGGSYVAFKLVFFGLATLALLAAGRGTLAVMFAVLVLVNLALGYLWGQEGEARADLVR